jgi:hypothetical protein
MRLTPRGLPLLALLTLAAFATSRVLPTAPRVRSVLSPVDGPPAAPGLLLIPDRVDLGCVEPGLRHEVPATWRRTGPGPVTVLATHTGCGCLGLTGLPSVLPEGASGSAVLALVASSDPGPIDTSVRVVLDVAPPSDVLRVRVCAYVGRSVVVRPAWLDLGRRPPGTCATSRFAVHVPPGVDPAEVEATLESWAGTLRLEPAALRSQSGPDLVLDSALPGVAGPVTGALVVRTRSAGAVVAALRAHVAGPSPPAQAPAGP